MHMGCLKKKVQQYHMKNWLKFMVYHRFSLLFDGRWGVFPMKSVSFKHSPQSYPMCHDIPTISFFVIRSYYILAELWYFTKLQALNGRCTARCWKMEKGCAEITMWKTCGAQMAENLCFILVFANPACGAKNCLGFR